MTLGYIFSMIASIFFFYWLKNNYMSNDVVWVMMLQIVWLVMSTAIYMKLDFLRMDEEEN